LAPLRRRARIPSQVHGTIAYETSGCFPGIGQCATAQCASPSRLQRTQSRMRQCPASPEHRISFCQRDYARRGATGVRSHREWQPFRFVLRRGRQRNDACHLGHEQYSVAGHADYSGRLCCRNGERYGRYSERELVLFGLHQRRDQQRLNLDDYLAGKGLPKLKTIIYRSMIGTNSPVAKVSRSGGVTR
jgi:hypothetical protein